MEIDPELVISIIATVIALSGVWYSRRRARANEQQLHVLKDQIEKKTKFTEVAEAVQVAVSDIGDSLKQARKELFGHKDFTAVSYDIIRFFHEKKNNKLILEVKPSKLELGSVETGQVTRFSRIDSFSDFWKKLEEILIGNFHPMINLCYECQPEIRKDPEISVFDFSKVFQELGRIYQSLRGLSEHENTIDAFDNRVSDDMQAAVKGIFGLIYDGLIRNHKMVIDKSNSLDEFELLILNEIVGLDDLEENCKSLVRGNIQLSDVQKRLLEASI